MRGERIITGVLLAVATALLTVALVHAWSAAGPNCPGMDPGWIGWCE